jgi:hypothetical protein
MNLPGATWRSTALRKRINSRMAVALHAAADHRPVEHAERGEQGGGAVPLVVMRHGLAAPGLDRQSRLGAVECLDLAFFVDRQHHRMRRRVDPRVRPMAARGQAPSPTMSVSLAAKPGSRERLNVRSRCGCSSCARQMRCTGPTEMPMALAIARPVQWVAWCGGTVHVNATAMAVAHRASRRGRPRVPSGQIVDRLVAPRIRPRYRRQRLTG